MPSRFQFIFFYHNLILLYGEKKRGTLVTEHQILGTMMVIQGLLLIVGIMIAFQIYREARDSAQKSREVEQLVSASLEVAREILRQIKR